MRLLFIRPEQVDEIPVEQARELLSAPDGLLWLDVEAWNEDAERLLEDVFSVHP